MRLYVYRHFIAKICATDMGRVFGFVVIFGLELLSVREFGYDKFGIWITGCCFVFEYSMRAIVGCAD